MKHNKDNPYKTKQEAMIAIRQWISEHCHEYPRTTMHVYSIYPFSPSDCKTIIIEDDRTHKTVRRFYYKESED